MIVVYHLEAQARRFHLASGWPQSLAAGVDMFFVLSGFLMWAITAERRHTPKDFLLQRAARIIPLYYLVTTCVVVLMLIAPSLIMSGKFSIAQTIGSYLFVALPTQSGSPYPVVPVGWTLNLEMFFYLVFAISLALPRKWRGIVVTGVLLAIVIAGATVLPENKWTYIYTSSSLLEFCYGMLIGEAYRRGHTTVIRFRAAIVLLLGGFVCVLFSAPNAPLRGLFAGVPAAAMFLGCLCLDQWHKKHNGFMKLMGDASYSIYLTHLMTLSATFQVWRALGLPLRAEALLLFCPLAVVASLVIGVALYVGVEKPLMDYFRRRRIHSKHQTAPALYGEMKSVKVR